MNKRIQWTTILAIAVLLLAMALAQPVSADAGNVTLTVLDSHNNTLDGVNLLYNDYGNHWVTLGTTAGGSPVTATFADGTYTIKAAKNYSELVATVVVTDTGSHTFQTSEFVVHVTDSGGVDFPGIAVAYNDYGNHYLSMGNTDSAGKALIELFPGTYTFLASKDHTSASGSTNGSIAFQTDKFTVKVIDSTGANFPGIAAYFNDYGNHNLNMGNTDTNGEAFIELFPGTYTFLASKDQTSASGSTSVSITFQTAKAIGIVKDCDGTPLAGFKVSFNDYGNHWLTMGITGGDGKASIELFPGTRKIMASIDYTSEAKDINLTLTETTVEFNPTRVNWQYSGTVKYNDYGNHWKTMSAPFYLFPGTYKFMFGDVQQDVTISNCSMQGSVLVIRLKDSQGNGVASGTAHLGVGGWPVIGTTDDNGNLIYFHNGLLGNMKIRMDAPFYGGSQESPVQDIAINSVFDFQTQQAVIQLKDSGGNLTDGGVVQAGAGGWPTIGTTGDDGTGTLYHEHFAGTFKYRMDYHGSAMEIQQDVSLPFIFQTTKAVVRLEDHNGNPLGGGQVLQGIGGWPQIGITGDSAPGELWYELFPGTHTFRMAYNYGSEERSQDISTPVVFQTALVSLQFGGTIQHGVGGWPAYTGPTEMLPVEHRFGFTAPGLPREEMRFTPPAGTAFERTIVFMKLLDSAGNGLAGGTASYYLNGWQNIPDPTNADGKLLYAIPGLTKTYSLKMSWAGYTQQLSNVNVTLPANTPVIFRTIPVVAHLQNSQQGALEGGEVEYYASGWKPFGMTDSQGNAGPVELLPGTYSFRLSFRGYTQQQSNVNIAATNPVVFQTVAMQVHFKNSVGNPLAGGEVQYYASGWKPFGETGSDGNTPVLELLPGTYSFKLAYAGYTQQKSGVNIALPANIPLEFQTLAMVVRLEEKTNNNGLAGGTVQYYASGWKPFGTTGTNGNTASVELLPGTYSFKMGYAGATEQKSNVDITATSNNPLVFQTVNAVMSVELRNSGGTGILGGVVQYYASGWKPFGTTDINGVAIGPNLLPGIYSFKMTYAGFTQQKSNVDIRNEENKPLVFLTSDMVVQFKDSVGNPIEGGVVQYYASGWNNFGVTDENGQASLMLLPGTYSFKMTYEGYTQQKSNVDISTINPLEFNTVLMEVQLKNSAGGALLEGAVQYYASGWRTFGDTVIEGKATKELLPGTYSFKMTYAGYTQQISNVDITATGNNPLIFQTVAMGVRLQTCAGAGLEGGAVQYYASGWNPFGSTGADGNIVKELLPGTYSFKLAWAGQTEQRSNVVVDAANHSLVYQTTQVALRYPEMIKYYAGGWQTFTSPMELLPYNYTFKFGSFQTQVDVSGCTLNKNVVILVLKDHLDKGLSGGAARGGFGTSYSGWFVPGSTDANGILFDYRDGSATTMSYEMRYNNTTQVVTHDVTTQAVFEFQTDLATMRLQTCAGTGLSGGTVRYGIGSTYTTWFFPGGATGENGETSAEMFPGTYSFEMGYQGTSEARVSVTVPAGSPLIWTTTKVTLQYSGQISYGGPTGQSAWFTKPSMEFLPGGTYKFHFQNPEAGRLDLAWSGCEFTQSVATLKLIDSGGNGISGASGQYYDGGWKNIPGSTDENGLLPFLVPGLKGNLPFAMNYAFARQEKSQNIASDSIVIFQTRNVVVELRDHAGVLDTLSEEGTVQYYSGGWRDIGPTSGGVVSIELLPLNYPFSMNYAFARQEKSQNVATDPTVVFWTALAEVQLVDHTGEPNQLPEEGTVQYYSGGWRDIGPTSGGVVSIELLPLNYPFSMNYAFARQEKSQNVGNDPTVVFQTQVVVVELLNSGGTRFGSDDLVQYYSGGWRDIGMTVDGAVSIELLPLSYPFSINHAFARQEKSQNVGGNPLITFQTTLVTVELKNSQNNLIGNGGTVQYYSGGWHDIGPIVNGTVTIELLPLSYSFSMNYAFARQEKAQNVGGNPLVTFQTGRVHSGSGNCVQYYAGGWQTFTQDMELLQQAYSFKFTDGSQKNFPITGGVENLID